MSTLMRDWIRTAVCKQLEEATNGNAQNGKGSNSYSKDGAYMIHFAEGRVVQLNEFISHAPPYLALLSDSFTRIRAVFTKSSTDKFLKEHKKPFSKGTNGAVLGITDYYLSPPPQRILLRIEAFSLQGSEGSCNFGRPIPVEMAEGIKELMSKSELELPKGGLDQANSPDRISPVQSQERTATDDSTSPEDLTQPGFSTQAPTKGSNGSGIVRHATLSASNQALLALLHEKRTKAQQDSIQDLERVQTSNPLCLKNLQNFQANRGSCSPISSFKSGLQSMIPSSSAIPHTEPGAGSKNKVAQLENHILLSQVISGSGVARSGNGSGAVDDDVNGGLPSREMSTGGNNKNGKNVHGDSNTYLRYAGTILKLYPTSNNIGRLIPDTDNPWEGLSRIPRKYVQISKDQRSILERDDAWYPEESKDRRPSIRLPPKILKEVQAFHDSLGNRVGIRDTHSGSDSNNGSPGDTNSDSYSEHSENEEEISIPESHAVEKAVYISIGSKNLHSLGGVSSGQRNARMLLTLSELASTDQSDSSVECSLDLARRDSEHDTGVIVTKGPNIQVGEILQNCEISEDKKNDVSITSPNQGDGNSEDETISWSASPHRVESYRPWNPRPQEEPEISVDGGRISGPISLPSQTSPDSILPIALVDAESQSADEDNATSGVGPFSVLQNMTELQPTEAAGRIAQASRTVFTISSGLFSSSPMEMELSVPYALGDQSQPPDDVDMTDIFDGDQSIPSTQEQPHSRFDLKTSHHTFSGSRSLGGNSRNWRPNENMKLRQHRDNISSDPIIPGTFRSDASHVSSHPRGFTSAAFQTELDSDNFEAPKVISATPDNPTCLYSYAPSLPVNENYLAQRQEHAESETRERKDLEARTRRGGSSSVNYAGEAVTGRQQNWNVNNVEILTSPTMSEPSQPLHTGSRMSSSEPLLPPLHALKRDEISISILTAPIKRRVSGVRDMIEPSPKRRRNLQAGIFDSTLEKDSAVNPTEMARANRRRFLQELSLSSPTQSPHKDNENSSARFTTASDTAAEISFENIITKDSLSISSDEISHTIPPQSQTETLSIYLEKTPVKNVPDRPQDNIGPEAGIIDEEGSEDKRKDNWNILESTDSQRSNAPQIFKCDSAETLGPGHSKDSHKSANPKSEEAQQLQTETIFDIFKTIYPSYNESLGAFIRACVYLDWLHSAKKAPHPTLWDDFIRAFSAEYLDHIKDCRISERKPMLALEFYNKNVSEPVFMERIMTLARLHEAFLLDPRETAKGRAKIQRKKHTNSQEPASTASSGATASKTLVEPQHAPRAFLDNFSSTQSLPNSSVSANRGTSDSSGDYEMVSIQVLDVVSSSDNRNPRKRPFFETSSQLVIQADHKKSPTSSTSIPEKDPRNHAVIEDPLERIESADIVTVLDHVVKQTPRRVPWSSLPQEKLTHGGKVDLNGVFSGRSNGRIRAPVPQQPPRSSFPRQREESPVLGCVISNLYSTDNQAIQSQIPPPFSSNLGSHQDPVFKTPQLPAAKSSGRRVMSMSGTVENRLENWRPSHRDEGVHSVLMAKSQVGLHPTTATFKEFSKAFVPRQKRRSSVSTRVSTPSSDASPDMLGFKTLAEPDTQAWRF